MHDKAPPPTFNPLDPPAWPRVPVEVTIGVHLALSAAAAAAALSFLSRGGGGGGGGLQLHFKLSPAAHAPEPTCGWCEIYRRST